MAAMSREQELDVYARLWAEYRAADGQRHVRVAGQRPPATVREKAVVVAAMRAHCKACFRHYEARRDQPEYDAYRAAMWLRRWFLHDQDKQDAVYTKVSPIAWRKKYEAEGGKTPR